MFKRKQRIFVGLFFGIIVGVYYKKRITGYNIQCLPFMLSEPSVSLGLTWLYNNTNNTITPFDIVNLPDESIEKLGSNGSLLMFVGVMTANTFLSTRAVAVYKTWGTRLPGSIAFFTSENSTVPEEHLYLPVVKLKGVDDVYPPQMKAFEMLRYMWENFGRYFEWFLRIDDDAYLNIDKIENFLHSLDSTIPYYIGQAGTGSPEKKAQLGLLENDNFCMGGPGVIFSRAMLYKMSKYIDTCIKEINTTEEDVELGLCIRRHLNYQCTWSYDMRFEVLYLLLQGCDSGDTTPHNTFEINKKMFENFYNNDSDPNVAYAGNLNVEEVNRAKTLHAIKVPANMYRLELHFQGKHIEELQHQNILLQREILEMSKIITVPLEISEETGDPVWFGKGPGLQKYTPWEEDDVLKWDFLYGKAVVSDMYYNPQQKTMSAIAEGFRIIKMNAGMIFYDMLDNALKINETLHGYYRVDPLHGVDYVLHIWLKHKSLKGKGRKNVYYQRQFTGLEIRETVNGIDIDSIEDEDDEDNVESTITAFGKSKKRKDLNEKVINFILPLAGRIETFKRFIGVYENICLKPKQRARLIVELYNTQVENMYNQTIALLNDLRVKYGDAEIIIQERIESFARAMALQQGTNRVKGEEDLLFFVDVDMIFDEDTLYRIRANTIKGKLVYFPIVFSEFDPSIVYNTSVSPDHYAITQDSGYWIQFGFGICSAHKYDISQAGGYDVSIHGWGGEDVDIFNKFIARGENISIFRAPDPGLIHVYHKRFCDKNLPKDQMVMCQGTRADTYVGPNQLANIIFNKGEKMFVFARKLNKLT